MLKVTFNRAAAIAKYFKAKGMKKLQSEMDPVFI